MVEIALYLKEQGGLEITQEQITSTVNVCQALKLLM
jgi:hypothetical protein